MPSTDKLTHSSHSNRLPSSSASPQSNHHSHQINQDDPCLVYWDDYQQLGFINRIKSSVQSSKNDLLKTPSKPSAKNPSLSKRNSTIAGIPSPSKPQNNDTPNQLHPNRKALRDSKRRKDKKTLPNPNNTTHQPAHSANTTPLPPKQRDALHALASRISFRHKPSSLMSNQPITSRVNLNSDQVSNSIKGKQPDRSDQNPTKLQPRNHPLSKKDMSSNSPNPITSKASSVRSASSSDSKSIKHNLKPNPWTHRQNPNSNASSSHSNQELPIQKCQTSINSNLPNQYHPRDESKLRHSTKPKIPAVEETASTKSIPHTTTIEMRDTEQTRAVGAPCEPWDVEEDDEFGSQLLELVDLVEKEQDEISSNPDLIKKNASNNSKEIKTALSNSPSFKNISNNAFHDKKKSVDSSRSLVSSQIQHKSNLQSKAKPHEMNREELPPRPQEDLIKTQTKTFTKQAAGTTDSKKQNSIRAAYKNNILVSKSIICNAAPLQPKNIHEPKKTTTTTSHRTLPVQYSNGLNQKPVSIVARKTEVIPITSMNKSTRQAVMTTTSIGYQSSKLTTINTDTRGSNSVHTAATTTNVNKVSYSTALMGNHLVQKIDHNITNPLINLASNGCNSMESLNKSLDLDSLFCGLVGEDLDWDPNE